MRVTTILQLRNLGATLAGGAAATFSGSANLWGVALEGPCKVIFFVTGSGAVAAGKIRFHVQTASGSAADADVYQSGSDWADVYVSGLITSASTSSPKMYTASFNSDDGKAYYRWLIDCTGSWDVSAAIIGNQKYVP